MSESPVFDLAFIGHYTQDTIVYPNSRRLVDGGAFYYGGHAALALGLRVAVVTRLARADWHVVGDLERMGITVFAFESPASTCLRLIYPTDNLDQRRIEVTSTAEPFTPDDALGVRARAWHVGATMRGEVPADVVALLAESGGPVSLDVQGYVRVGRDGVLGHDDWPGKEAFLQHVTVCKADAVEARWLTGESDPRVAARRIAAYGPSEVLVTHSGGVLLCHAGAIHEAPFLAREVRGRSGRGDTCTGAYMSRRLTSSPADSLAWAAAVTSLKLETEGPFRRDLSEVEALYERIRGEIW